MDSSCEKHTGSAAVSQHCTGAVHMTDLSGGGQAVKRVAGSYKSVHDAAQRLEHARLQQPRELPARQALDHGRHDEAGHCARRLPGRGARPKCLRQLRGHLQAVLRQLLAQFLPKRVCRALYLHIAPCLDGLAENNAWNLKGTC